MTVLVVGATGSIGQLVMKEAARKRMSDEPSSAIPEKHASKPRTQMTSKSPLLTLNNGVQIPAIGLGVFQSAPEQTVDRRRIGDCSTAIGSSTRPRRTPTSGRSEKGCAGLASPRDDMFIETKVWISDYGYEATLHAFDKSAGKLGVDRLDLLLLHQPLPSRFDLTLDAYRALEKLLADGKVRAIGVSNFMPEHLQRLLAETSVVPAVNQIEVHPYFQQMRAAASARRARHPDASLVADRRDHLLPWW